VKPATAGLAGCTRPTLVATPHAIASGEARVHWVGCLGRGAASV